MDKPPKIDLAEWVKLRGSGFVIKVRGGKPYIARKPKRDGNRRKSDAEQKQVDLFKKAVRYAKEVLADPKRVEQYAETAKAAGKPVYNTAISDYIRRHEELSRREKLDIREVQFTATDRYNFLKIFIDNPEPFRKMNISIQHLHGEIIEDGAAEQATVDSWWYILKDPGLKNFPFKVKIEAFSPNDVILEGQYVQL